MPRVVLRKPKPRGPALLICRRVTKPAWTRVRPTSPDADFSHSSLAGPELDGSKRMLSACMEVRPNEEFRRRGPRSLGGVPGDGDISTCASACACGGWSSLGVVSAPPSPPSAASSDTAATTSSTSSARSALLPADGNPSSISSSSSLLPVPVLVAGDKGSLSVSGFVSGGTSSSLMVGILPIKPPLYQWYQQQITIAAYYHPRMQIVRTTP
mmetsp:Transcript_31374/g.91953  ORF Transcript_31374/g.91953 Transcript_31374/m.91953 type:complete len:212 (-) Transcript_31374:90-725(-)